MNKEKISHIGKWKKIEISDRDIRQIYQKSRQKVKTIIINKYKKQYLKELKKIMDKEFIFYSDLVNN